METIRRFAEMPGGGYDLRWHTFERMSVRQIVDAGLEHGTRSLPATESSGGLLAELVGLIDGGGPTVDPEEGWEDGMAETGWTRYPSAAWGTTYDGEYVAEPELPVADLAGNCAGSSELAEYDEMTIRQAGSGQETLHAPCPYCRQVRCVSVTSGRMLAHAPPLSLIPGHSSRHRGEAVSVAA